MKILIGLLLVMSLRAEEFYMQPDKQKHFVGSMAIGAAASGIARHYGSSKFEAIAIGVASSLLVGVAKEKLDGAGYGTEDINDVYADALGATTGSILSTQFNWRF